MIERIKDLAIVIRKGFTLEDRGIKFITSPESIQQVGIMKWFPGHIVTRHYHQIQPKRKAVYTQEVLIIRKGQVRVDLYSHHEKYEQSVVLKKGDIICLLSGGHGIMFEHESELLEIKQGPYSEKSDKVKF